MRISPLILNINQINLPQKNQPGLPKLKSLYYDTFAISFKGDDKTAERNAAIRKQAKQIRELKLELKQKEEKIIEQKCLIENIIALGSKANSRDSQNRTLLHYASLTSWNTKPETVELLINNGFDVHAKDKIGYTPLHYAADGDSPEIIQTLVKHKANINEEANNGSTPLHVAALWNKNEEIIKTLIDLGADVNARNKDFETPILNAVKLNQNPKIVKMLLEHGADPHADDLDGWTACEYVREFRMDEEVYKLLEPYYLERQAKIDEIVNKKQA